MTLYPIPSDGRILFYARDRAEYWWLSNFARAPFTDREGTTWPTAEHAFQAMKNPDPAFRRAVLAAPTPQMAKSIGRSNALRPHWDRMRLRVMRGVLDAKFHHGSGLAVLLLQTGEAELVEDSPSDYFWGVGRKGTGQNALGVLLMEIREERYRDREAEADALHFDAYGQERR